MPKCDECGQTFDAADAKLQYESAFDGDLEYDEYGTGRCGDCAVMISEGHMNQGRAIDMMNGEEDYDADHVEKYL